MGKNGWFKGNASESGQLNGFLDKGSSFEGKLTFDGVLQINGEFRGEIISDGTLIVGPAAHIVARIMVDTLIIDGNVEGEVQAKSRIEVHVTGRLIANIVARNLVISEGGLFQGSSHMQGE